MIKRTLLILCLFLLSITSATASERGGRKKNEPIRVVASFTILADMVKQIGKDKVQVNSLIGIGEEVHDFHPSPDDAIKLTRADIIAINGLSFEGWMHRLIKASETKAKLLVASTGVYVRWMDEDGKEIPDPHAWLSLKNAQHYALNIRNALTEIRPKYKDEFKKNTHAYIKKLKELDKQAKLTFSTIPKEYRNLVTNHDAFGYFARDYDIYVKPLVGLNVHDEPSPKEMASIIHYVKDQGVQTIFIEDLTDGKLIKQIAEDTGIKIGKPLYTGSLSHKKGGARTYLEMMETNIGRINNGLRGVR